MRISDWSSDVCSSDLVAAEAIGGHKFGGEGGADRLAQVAIARRIGGAAGRLGHRRHQFGRPGPIGGGAKRARRRPNVGLDRNDRQPLAAVEPRSEERREGKEWVSTCRYRWGPDNKKKKKKE